eukprot:c24512_g1_i1.p1 GENE.c24512_g1_i1~~c24512_g1_i1.p1  ORF type:complete len:174 (-),score=67.55 c24512_g1_i1:38-511(-)
MEGGNYEGVHLQQNDKGRGVYSSKKFKKDDVVVIGKRSQESSERTHLTLQVDTDKHFRFDMPFESVNHSCDPNCGLKANEFGGYNLVAMRDIEENEEISFDYAMSEWISIAVPENGCKCNSSICRHTIQGGKYLSNELLQKYQGYLAPFYEKMKEQN